MFANTWRITFTNLFIVFWVPSDVFLHRHQDQAIPEIFRQSNEFLLHHVLDFTKERQRGVIWVDRHLLHESKLFWAKRPNSPAGCGIRWWNGHREIAEVDKNGIVGGTKMEDPTVANANETWCARMKKSMKGYFRYSPRNVLNPRLNLEPHTVKKCVYKMCCLHHPSLTWESLLLVNENLEKNIVLNCSILSKKPPL